jgi:hypothetical protein
VADGHYFVAAGALSSPVGGGLHLPLLDDAAAELLGAGDVAGGAVAYEAVELAAVVVNGLVGAVFVGQVGIDEPVGELAEGGAPCCFPVAGLGLGLDGLALGGGGFGGVLGDEAWEGELFEFFEGTCPGSSPAGTPR